METQTVEATKTMAATNGNGEATPSYPKGLSVKEGKDGKTRTKVVTPPGRATFLYLEKPDTGREYSNDRYHMTLIIPKTTDIKLLKQAVAITAKANGLDLTTLQHPFRDGDTDSNSKYDGFHESIYIHLKGSKEQPPIFRDRENRLIAASTFYPGCWVRCEVTAFPFKSTKTVEREIEKNGKVIIEKVTREVLGVSFGLEQVQFLKDGPRFGGGAAEFEDDIPDDFFGDVQAGSASNGNGSGASGNDMEDIPW